MEKQGWIRLHRKIQEKGYYKNSKYVHLWIHLLLLANHKSKEFMWNKQIIVIKEGQLITGRDELSRATGIKSGSVENILRMLESEHQIEQQKTTKYRLITILNWKEHQTNNNTSDNKVTTKYQQNDTNKNDNNTKNEKKDTAEINSAEISLLIKEFEFINPAVKRMYGNKTQRKACADLISNYSFERVITVIKNTLPKTNKMTAEFFPNISTPLQLFEKWQKLEDAIFAYRAKKQIKNNNVIW
jgi:hypothetical protein